MANYCLHCFHEFMPLRAWFRCTNDSCSGRKVDNIYNSSHGGFAAPPTGLAFSPSLVKMTLGVLGGIKRLRCPVCSEETTKRICPFCHNELFEDSAKVPHKIIALFGSSSSGKTCYLASALLAFPTVLSKFGYNGHVSGDRSRELARKFSPLITEGRVPSRTVSQQSEPIVFRLTSDNVGSCSMDIFDCGGDAVSTRSQIQLNIKQARLAKGFIFMIDPYQLIDLRPLLQKAGIALTPNQYDDLPSNVLNRLIEAFEGWGMSPDGMIQAPFAFVVTKMDVWRDTISTRTPLHDPSAAVKHSSSTRADLDYSVIDVESDAIKEQLLKWDSNLCALIEQRFERYKFFAVSALGANPVGGIVPLPVRPDRVEIPMLWIAQETEIISI